MAADCLSVRCVGRSSTRRTLSGGHVRPPREPHPHIERDGLRTFQRSCHCPSEQPLRYQLGLVLDVIEKYQKRPCLLSEILNLPTIGYEFKGKLIQKNLQAHG